MEFKLNTVLKIYLVLFCFSNATQVTFIVDMSEETVVAGDGNYPAVYVSGANINGPGGLAMTDNGDGTWELTTQLSPGDYTYKFRNGYYDYWDGPGWESDNGLIEGGCAVGDYFDRQVSVGNSDLVEGGFCFGSCDELCNSDSIEYIMVWSDEFDSPNIDMGKWSYDVGTGNWGWGNDEAQYYTSNFNNSFIENGNLVIQALLQNYGGANYTSARMVTRNKADWTYGKIEVRAKLPAGIGTWPAIWMLPTDYVYGGWPNSGEMDIMEAVGHVPGVIHGTAHTDLYNWYDGSPPPGGQITVSDYNNQFHDYILEWTENNLKWYVDDTHYFTYSNNNQGWSSWPFDQDFHLLLNIAIGGTWGGQQGIDDSIFPVRMEVDYIRVYEASSELPSQARTTPNTFNLHRNYPNPFNPITTLSYELPEQAHVTLTIYDLVGREITRLVNTTQGAGVKSIQWEATNNIGQTVSAGIYLYMLQVGNLREFRKMVLVK